MSTFLKFLKTYETYIKDIKDRNFDSTITKARTILEETFCYVIDLKKNNTKSITFKCNRKIINVYKHGYIEF